MDDEFGRKIKNKNDEITGQMINSEENKLDYSTFSSDIENPFKIIKKELTDLLNIYEELGIWSLSSACVDSIKTIRRALETCKHCLSKELIDNIADSIEENIFFIIRQTISLEDQNNIGKILEFSSVKVNCLVEILRSSYNAKKFHAIVFVERKYTAYYLDQILQNIRQLPDYDFIKSDYVFGNTRQNIKEIMNNAKQVNKRDS